MPPQELLTPLKRYFGHDSFKPLQEAIVRDYLAGRDVVALLPTGGGKSLCYQLPALVRPGLTVVVSPLIALMKDQVDALQAAGVPATFLNSSLNGDQTRERLRLLDERHYRLLYVAPERLMLGEFFADLKRWGAAAVAVDEAHCISEWGHDFRPEYRMLAKMRELFPQAPIIALTATATQRVRDDIAQSLQLRNPRFHVGSFNRPNLRYMVAEKLAAYSQLLAFIRQRKGESGIVYGLSRKTAVTLADRLHGDGIRAVPYHAGMATEDRNRSQEQFIRDDADVVCATIAFGMGINKPDVRFVVHYDLPKHIEGYYQETGRAGRDGLPSQCLLLFQVSDAFKLKSFIDDITDPAERERSLQKLNDMVHFAESSGCRRAALLAYFGEAWPLPNCDGCDNCLTPRETYDGTLAAQKFMSCVYRIQEKSGFGTGLNHVVDVLVGSMGQKVQGWGHHQISTFGIGKDLGKAEWKAIGRELIRLGLVRQNAAGFETLELTPVGLMTLKQRTPVALTKTSASEAAEARPSSSAIECDEKLFEELRVLRKQLADARGVPAYVIFSDVALRHMARNYRTDRESFRRINGVGDKKLEEYAATFIEAIQTYLTANQQKTTVVEAPPLRNRRRSPKATLKESMQLFRDGWSIQQVDDICGMDLCTLHEHIAYAIQSGELSPTSSILTTDQQQAIRAAIAELGPDNTVGLLKRLGEGYDYGLLKVYRAIKQRSQGARS